MSDDVAADVRVLALSLGGIVVTALIVFAVLSLNCVREAEEDKSCCGLGGLSSAILGTCFISVIGLVAAGVACVAAATFVTGAVAGFVSGSSGGVWLGAAFALTVSVLLIWCLAPAMRALSRMSVLKHVLKHGPAAKINALGQVKPRYFALKRSALLWWKDAAAFDLWTGGADVTTKTGGADKSAQGGVLGSFDLASATLTRHQAAFWQNAVAGHKTTRLELHSSVSGRRLALAFRAGAEDDELLAWESAITHALQRETESSKGTELQLV